jgi:hypothetical protein
MKRRAGAWDLLRERSEKIRRDVQQLWSDVHVRASVTSPDLKAPKIVAGELSKWQDTTTPILQGIRDVLTKMESETTRDMGHFDQDLAREVTIRGHVVHGEAPLLIIDGIVHIDIDLKELHIVVNGVEVPELTVEAAAAAVEEEATRLRKILTPPQRMLEDMLLAYQRELRISEKHPGTQVQAAAIMMQLAFLRQPASFRSNPQSQSFREYPRELFRADLFTLLADGLSAVNGRTLRYASGSDTSGAIFMMVPAMGRAAHVGRIWFDGSRE